MNSNVELNSKRTQCDYTLEFKLLVVSLVEQGEFTCKQSQMHYGIQGKSTVLVWLRKYGQLDWSKGGCHPDFNKQTPVQKIRFLQKTLHSKERYISSLEEKIKQLDELSGAHCYESLKNDRLLTI